MLVNPSPISNGAPVILVRGPFNSYLTKQVFSDVKVVMLSLASVRSSGNTSRTLAEVFLYFKEELT